MKKLIFFVAIMFFISCEKKIPQEVLAKISKNETYWENRNIMITKNESKLEYPIKKNISINELRNNAIDVGSSSVQFEIFINDVLLFNFKGEGSQNQGGAIGTHDINHLLLTSGTHEVKVRMYPALGKKVFGDEGSVGLIFIHYPFDNIKQITYNNSTNGSSGIRLDQENEQWIDDVGEYGTPSFVKAHYAPKQPLNFKGLPIYEWSSTFVADVPFDLVGWRNSVNLKNELKNEKRDIKLELISEYRKIYDIIKNKDVRAYLDLVKEREEIIARTLYYDNNMQKQRDNEFVKLLQSDEYEIEPLYEESFQLEFQGYGKLVTFLHKADGEGIIRLKNKNNPDEMIYLDFMFQRRKKGDKLTVI